ncbi:GxxExxY protein [Opitutus sp. GAS368]|uniref:GxxExxY protein n=1 Tax=Opitutus sp. GAS368 TaxID=1882749 RepID=UPI00087A0BC1|nr:GxxExxY protein [Opitutus sp. GAS368]SDR92480.1 GxxExxY protein [Opitutus sp. GAS368]
MDTNGHEEGQILHKELVYSVVGCALEVLKEVGHGLHEKPYENALVVEFKLKGISCEQQRRFDVLYKGIQVAEFVPDLIAGGVVVVDTKVIERITDLERGQMLNYLRITKLRVGLIINFKRAKLEWERIIL